MAAKHTAAHPGLQAIGKKAEASAAAKHPGWSEERLKNYAYGGVANAARNAGKGAKKANPRLHNVKG